MYTYTVGYDDEEVYVKKGHVIGGNAIGILIASGDWLPLVPGNVGNATTFSFPVYYKYVEGDVNQSVTAEPDPIFLQKFIKAAKELETEGCRAITSCCGYFANYLPEITAAVNIPAFLSSLMQIPIISRAIKPSQKVGIICASGRILSSAPVLKNCGVDDLSRVVIAGAEGLPQMQNVLRNTGHLNNAKFAEELAGLAKQTVNENPDIGAILIECTEMAPYACAIQKAVRLPIFDFTTMVNWVYNAVVRRPFAGYV